MRLALGAVMQGCTATQAGVLMSRADDDALSADLRALGIRARRQPVGGDAELAAPPQRRQEDLFFRRRLAPSRRRCWRRWPDWLHTGAPNRRRRRSSPRRPGIRIPKSATRQRVGEARGERTGTIPHVTGPGAVDDGALRRRAPGARARDRRVVRAPALVAGRRLASAVLVPRLRRRLRQHRDAGAQGMGLGRAAGQRGHPAPGVRLRRDARRLRGVPRRVPGAPDAAGHRLVDTKSASARRPSASG